MPDFAAVAPPSHTRPSGRVLTLLTIPIVAFIAMSNVGDAMAPSLVDHHPLLLIALNPRNRNLILVTNHLSAWSYYVVGTVRLVISDPLFFLIGLWWGDAALVWTERRTRTLGRTLRQWEGWFHKAAYPLVFIAPNQWICLFAGAAGMDVVPFFVVNIAGTLARLYVLRWLGNAFQHPIDDVLHFIAHYRTPLLIASFAIVIVFVLAEVRGGGPGLDELDQIEEELAEGADGPAGDAPEDEETQA